MATIEKPQPGSEQLEWSDGDRAVGTALSLSIVDLCHRLRSALSAYTPLHDMQSEETKALWSIERGANTLVHSFRSRDETTL